MGVFLDDPKPVGWKYFFDVCVKMKRSGVVRAVTGEHLDVTNTENFDFMKDPFTPMIYQNALFSTSSTPNQTVKIINRHFAFPAKLIQPAGKCVSQRNNQLFR